MIRLAAIGLIAAVTFSAGSAWSQTSPTIRLVDYINVARLGAGLPLLRESFGLSRAASKHARDMADNNFLEHTGSDGSELAERIDRVGYAWSFIAENVAAGPPTPQQTVRAGVKSTEHRDTILNKDIEVIGVGHAVIEGTARRQSYKHYWVVIFAKARR